MKRKRRKEMEESISGYRPGTTDVLVYGRIFKGDISLMGKSFLAIRIKTALCRMVRVIDGVSESQRVLRGVMP